MGFVANLGWYRAGWQKRNKFWRLRNALYRTNSKITTVFSMQSNSLLHLLYPAIRYTVLPRSGANSDGPHVPQNHSEVGGPGSCMGLANYSTIATVEIYIDCLSDMGKCMSIFPVCDLPCLWEKRKGGAADAHTKRERTERERESQLSWWKPIHPSNFLYACYDCLPAYEYGESTNIQYEERSSRFCFGVFF